MENIDQQKKSSRPPTGSSSSSSRTEKSRQSMRKKRRQRGAHRMTSNVFNMFNQQQIQEFKEAFKMIDQDQDGFIDADDLKEIFTSLGADPNDDFVNEMIAEAPGAINFTMFLTLFGQNMNSTDPLETLEQAFSIFDETGSGKIKKSDLEFLLKNIGDRYTQQQVNDLFRDCDIDADGYFDYRQLAHIMKYGNPEEDEQ